mmetsp:Transcript_54212/g.124855  ORF Transcript_54212/g.124855 Transcript_54212/m.124855 type:complete len:326 (-) Transcript_54212:172-1149(-)
MRARRDARAARAPSAANWCDSCAGGEEDTPPLRHHGCRRRRPPRARGHQEERAATDHELDDVQAGGLAVRSRDPQAGLRQDERAVRGRAPRADEGVAVPRDGCWRGGATNHVCARQGFRLLLGRRALDRARVGGARGLPRRDDAHHERAHSQPGRQPASGRDGYQVYGQGREQASRQGLRRHRQGRRGHTARLRRLAGGDAATRRQGRGDGGHNMPVGLQGVERGRQAPAVGHDFRHPRQVQARGGHRHRVHVRDVPHHQGHEGGAGDRGVHSRRARRSHRRRAAPKVQARRFAALPPAQAPQEDWAGQPDDDVQEGDAGNWPPL